MQKKSPVTHPSSGSMWCGYQATQLPRPPWQTGLAPCRGMELLEDLEVEVPKWHRTLVCDAAQNSVRTIYKWGLNSFRWRSTLSRWHLKTGQERGITMECWGHSQKSKSKNSRNEETEWAEFGWFQVWEPKQHLNKHTLQKAQGKHSISEWSCPIS